MLSLLCTFLPKMSIFVSPLAISEDGRVINLKGNLLPNEFRQPIQFLQFFLHCFLGGGLKQSATTCDFLLSKKFRRFSFSLKNSCNGNRAENLWKDAFIRLDAQNSSNTEITCRNVLESVHRMHLMPWILIGGLQFLCAFWFRENTSVSYQRTCNNARPLWPPKRIRQNDDDEHCHISCAFVWISTLSFPLALALSLSCTRFISFVVNVVVVVVAKHQIDVEQATLLSVSKWMSDRGSENTIYLLNFALDAQDCGNCH